MPNVVLRDCKVYVLEVTAQTAELAAAHARDIHYRTIVRTPFSQIRNIPYNQEVNEQLTTFSSDSAGIAFWVRPTAPSPSQALTRYGVQQLTIRDSTNTDLLYGGLLPTDLVRAFIQPYQIPASENSSGAARSYVVSFGSNLVKTLDNGTFTGGLRMTGDQRLVFMADDSYDSATISAISYEYAWLKVRAGQAVLERHA